MTSRSTFLIFVALLLIASLAGAAEMSQAVPPTTPAGAPAFMAPAATSPGCAKAELPFLAPTPSQKTGLPCGSCSDTVCQGLSTNDLCGFRNGRYYYCKNLLGDACSAGGWKCNCTFQDIP